MFPRVLLKWLSGTTFDSRLHFFLTTFTLQFRMFNPYLEHEPADGSRDYATMPKARPPLRRAGPLG